MSDTSYKYCVAQIVDGKYFDMVGKFDTPEQAERCKNNWIDSNPPYTFKVIKMPTYFLKPKKKTN